MDNREFTRLLCDAKENLNQLNKIVEDNTKAQEFILDNFLNHPIEQILVVKKATSENKPAQKKALLLFNKIKIKIYGSKI